MRQSQKLEFPNPAHAEIYQKVITDLCQRTVLAAVAGAYSIDQFGYESAQKAFKLMEELGAPDDATLQQLSRSGIFTSPQALSSYVSNAYLWMVNDNRPDTDVEIYLFDPQSAAYTTTTEDYIMAFCVGVVNKQLRSFAMDTYDHTTFDKLPYADVRQLMAEWGERKHNDTSLSTFVFKVMATSPVLLNSFMASGLKRMNSDEAHGIANISGYDMAYRMINYALSKYSDGFIENQIDRIYIG